MTDADKTRALLRGLRFWPVGSEARERMRERLMSRGHRVSDEEFNAPRIGARRETV